MFKFGWYIMAAAICPFASLLPVRASAATADPWQSCGDGLPSFSQVLSPASCGSAPTAVLTSGSLANGTEVRI
jgi:hypothetical protein